MACEVLCCEVSAVLNTLAEEKDGALLEQLFAVVTAQVPASHRLAGYFEKVLHVVFRSKSISVIGYLDAAGPDLFRAFVRQLHSHSVMQALRLLLLPAVQLGRDDGAAGFQIDNDEDDEDGPGGRRKVLECSWHRDSTFVAQLVEIITSGGGDHDTSSSSTVAAADDARAHAAELLNSIMDLAGAGSALRNALTNAATIEALAAAAVPPLPAGQQSAGGDGSAGTMVAALSVLEVAVVQFCDEHAAMAAAASAAAEVQLGVDNLAALLDAAGDAGRAGPPPAVVAVLVTAVPRVAQHLAAGGGGSGETVADQRGGRVARLGLARLKLVNLVEALLRLRHPAVDEALADHGVPAKVLDLFFAHEWNSLLHQSAMAMVMLIVEGADRAGSAQPPSPPPEREAGGGGDGQGPDGEGAAGAGRLRNARTNLQRHLLAEGRLLERLMVVFAPRPEVPQGEPRKGACSRAGHFGHAVVMCESVMKGIVEGGSLADLVSASEAGPAWHDFMLSTLSEVTALQCRPVGGLAYPRRHDDVMQSMGEEGELSDEALAEQISQLGLGNGPSGLGCGGGGDDDDDEEEDAILAAALAAQYGAKGSSIGGNEGGGRFGADGERMSYDNDGGGGDDDDDDEEDAIVAAMLAAQAGKGSGLGMRPGESRGGGAAAAMALRAEAAAGGSGGGSSGTFADFDAFGSGAEGGVGGEGDGGEPEADDFANWGDSAGNTADSSDAFADFSDLASPQPRARASSADEPPASPEASPAKPLQPPAGEAAATAASSAAPRDAAQQQLFAADFGAASADEKPTAASDDAVGSSPAAAPEPSKFDAVPAASDASSFDAFGSAAALAAADPDDASFDAFGSAAPTVATDGPGFDSFGDSAAAAAAPAAAGFGAFGESAPAASDASSVDAFGSAAALAAADPDNASFDAFGSAAVPAAAPDAPGFDAFGDSAAAAAAPAAAGLGAFGESAPAASDLSSVDAFGSAAALAAADPDNASFDAFGSAAVPAAAPDAPGFDAFADSAAAAAAPVASGFDAFGDSAPASAAPNPLLLDAFGNAAPAVTATAPQPASDASFTADFDAF